MPPQLHLLATCRKEELLPAATMVFKTLRTGFPTAEVFVDVNQWPNGPCHTAMVQAAITEGCHVHTNIGSVTHYQWILNLLDEADGPFWILDTDVVFWDSFEQFDFSGCTLAGRLIPKFFDAFTRCVTQPRLHTSLLYFDPERIKEAVTKFFAEFPDTIFNPRPNLIAPCWFPILAWNPKHSYPPTFFDCCSMLYNAIGGTAFEEKHLDAFSHMNFATISDLVAPHYPNDHFREQHFAAFENPSLLRGCWRDQDKWYAARAVEEP